MINFLEAYPCLINQKGVGKIIKVEAYEIDDKILSRLDIFENHPIAYYRDEITLIVNDKEIDIKNDL